MLCWCRYGQSFGAFIDAEFGRLDQDHDQNVSLNEFRACYGRYNLMYRSSHQDERHDYKHVTFSPSVPQQMVDQAISAIDHMWNALQHGLFVTLECLQNE